MKSPDAFAFGTRNTPDDACRFAKGKAITQATSGLTIQERTPYDWAAVTDHSEYLSIMPLLLDPNSPLQKTEIGQLISSGDPADGEAAFKKIIMSTSINQPINYPVDPKIMKTAWQGQVDAANTHYAPGKFTTLIVYEWSSQPNAQNLHHNVFFRDDQGPEVPFSFFDSTHLEDLWAWQEKLRKAGHENFPISHNANVSDSMMYALHKSDGAPIDKAWAEMGTRNTVATEIVQTKGASETHPAQSPHDEFADFESGFKHLLGSGGVWAPENTREAIFDGIKRRETYGTSGPLIRPRFFGGWDYADELVEDPDFDPALHAVYYVRVIEIPTPRRSVFDAKQLGIEPPAGARATIQERAWSSPIWYTPVAGTFTPRDYYPGLENYLQPESETTLEVIHLREQ